MIGLLGGRAEPEVEVQFLGRLLGVFEADAPARLGGVGLGDQQLAVLAAGDGGHGLDPTAVAAALRAVLDDAAVLAGLLTHCRPSNTLWLQGFSTYTSLPAWHAQNVIKACQWLQVATETASRVLSSSALRMSWTHLGVLPPFAWTCLLRLSKTRLSGSIRYATSTSFMLAKASMWLEPRPWMPATPRRIRSLAPMILPEAFVPAMAKVAAIPPAAACCRNARRVCRDMGDSLYL